MDNSKPTFEQVYHGCYANIYAYIAARVENTQTAEDLTQTVFVAAWRHWGEFDPCKSSVRTWLYCIAKNTLKNHLRCQRQALSLEELRASGAPDPAADSMRAAACLLSQREALAKALGELPPQQRRMIILRYFGGKTSREIAQEMGLTDTNVRTGLARTLRRLYEILEANGLHWEDIEL